MIPHMSLIDLAEQYQTTHIVQLTKKEKKKKRTPTRSRPLYIIFIIMICAVLSLSSFLFSLMMHFQLELDFQELSHLRSIPLVLQNP